jgi:hypothetical protein
MLPGIDTLSVGHVDEKKPAPHPIRLSLSHDEWREFQDYVRRQYGDVERFFTEKALELIVAGRERAGRRPN